MVPGDIVVLRYEHYDFPQCLYEHESLDGMRTVRGSLGLGNIINVEQWNYAVIIAIDTNFSFSSDNKAFVLTERGELGWLWLDEFKPI